MSAVRDVEVYSVEDCALLDDQGGKVSEHFCQVVHLLDNVVDLLFLNPLLLRIQYYFFLYLVVERTSIDRVVVIQVVVRQVDFTLHAIQLAYSFDVVSLDVP